MRKNRYVSCQIVSPILHNNVFYLSSNNVKPLLGTQTLDYRHKYRITGWCCSNLPCRVLCSLNSACQGRSVRRGLVLQMLNVYPVTLIGKHSHKSTALTYYSIHPVTIIVTNIYRQQKLLKIHVCLYSWCYFFQLSLGLTVCS